MPFRLFTTNIKIGLKVDEDGTLRERIKTLSLGAERSWGNFFVRRRRFVHTIFLNGHVNITGIPNYVSIDSALSELRHLLNIEKEKKLTYKIDNICSRGKTAYSHILLRPLFSQVREHLRSCYFLDFILDLRYEPDQFPALHLKTRIGSILIFGSGKYILLGYRQALDGFFLCQVLHHLLGLDRDGAQHCPPLQSERFLRP